jgi:hypothetical protein
MSNFTYEIDERNLRLRMKDFMVPVKQDAWQKFESYSETTVSEKLEGRLKNFNFSLNRNVVLPSVFGVVIILFSFLLVNFVSIKSSAKENTQKAEASPAVSSTPSAPQEQLNKQAVPAVAKPKQQSEMPAEEVKVPDVKPEEKAILNNLVSTSATIPEQVPASSVQAIPAEPGGDSVAKQDEEVKSKRRAERRAARAEAQKLEEIRPTPVAEERDVEEVRPD